MFILGLLILIALFIFRATYKISPEDRRIQDKLRIRTFGTLGVWDDRFDKARSALREESLGNPILASAGTIWHMALSLLIAKKYDEAEKYFQRLIENHPDYLIVKSGDVHFWRACNFWQAEKNKPARDALAELREFDENRYMLPWGEAGDVPAKVLEKKLNSDGE